MCNMTSTIPNTAVDTNYLNICMSALPFPCIDCFKRKIIL